MKEARGVTRKDMIDGQFYGQTTDLSKQEAGRLTNDLVNHISGRADRARCGEDLAR